MKTRFIKIVSITLFFLVPMALFSQTNMVRPFSGIENTKEYKTIDLIYMDKDLSIFANLLTMSGLNTSLAVTDKEHTLFIPTNDAFTDMTIENFAELTNPKNRANLVDFVNRHFVSTKIQSHQMTEQKVITQNGKSNISISNTGNDIGVGGASIVAADIETSNGVIHVLNDVINVTQ